MTTMHPSRRGFVHAITAAGLALPAVLPPLARADAPSGKLNIAGIGVGGMGHNNLRQMRTENIVAICDVDHRHADKSFKLAPGAKRYFDYREMLATQDDIDAVLIATPDHTHAVIAAAAMRAGKHVYCQKPLTHDIAEARYLAELAAKTGVITQMGNQYNSSNGIRLLCEWVWSGAIGEVREVDAWCSLKYRPFGHAWWATTHGEPPADTPPVPDHLDWDTWIGPAPMRPYHPTYHPAKWRAWWDFGNGMMGDRGVHTLDSVFWALKLGAPTRIELLKTSGSNEHIHPDVAHVRFHFGARGDMPPVVVNWHQGEEPPTRPKELPDNVRIGDDQGGAILKGTDGIIMHGTYAGSVRIWPEARLREVGTPEQVIPRVGMHHEQAWIAACKAGKNPSSHFGYSGPLTELTLLGNLAIRLGGTIDWDAEHMQATARPEADALIRTKYRKGWSLAGDTGV